MNIHFVRAGLRSSSRTSAAIAAALLPVALFTSPSGAREQIAIVNAGFESPPYALCGFGPTTGWTGGSGGTWRPGINQCPLNGFPGGIPEGVQIGFVNYNTNALSQVLSAVLEPNTQYRLSVEVGRRLDGFQMDSYKVQLLAGATLLVEDPGTLDPANGTFETSIICVTTGAIHPAMGQPLKIVLAVDGGVQVNFDDVHLEKLPPGTECDVFSVPGDFDGDGDVDGGDLGLMLGAWGPCGNCSNCAADLDGDCDVDGGDLGLLLGSWG